MPVRLFSGARSSGISFNMLHRTDKSRLKQQYVCLADGQVVDRSDIVKGYEFRKDEYIIIEPDEMDYERPLAVAMPYLGKVVGEYTDWTPLYQRGELFAEDLDTADPWQFKNIRVI